MNSQKSKYPYQIIDSLEDFQHVLSPEYLNYLIAIYVRVSTDDQAKNGYSIDDQIDKNIEKAQAEYKAEFGKELNAKQIILYIDDGISGEILNRPKIVQLRNDLATKLIKKVYCYDPDRLSRNLRDQLVICDDIDKYSKLIFVNMDYQKTPEGILFFTIRTAIGQFEKDKIKQRTTNGRLKKASNGKIIKNYGTYGYTYDKESGQLIPHKEQARWVKFIFDAYTNRVIGMKFHGINSIAKYLTNEKVLTAKGNTVWHRQVVRQILTNRTYMGDFIQNRWDYQGMLGNKYATRPEDKVRATIRSEENWIHIQLKPENIIIPKEQFDYAQQLITTGKDRWKGFERKEYLLSGLLRCGMCGNTMTGRLSKNVKYYTDKKSTAGAKNEGCSKYVKCETIDEFVWDEVINMLNKYSGSLEIPQQSQAIESFEKVEMARLTKMLEEKRDNHKNFLDMVHNGMFKKTPMSQLAIMIQEKENELEEMEVIIKQLESIVQNEKSVEFKENVYKEAFNFYNSKNFNELTFEDKRSLIMKVVREIQVYEDEIKILLFA